MPGNNQSVKTKKNNHLHSSAAMAQVLNGFYCDKQGI
jgi:hypothetical protein